MLFSIMTLASNKYESKVIELKFGRIPFHKDAFVLSCVISLV